MVSYYLNLGCGFWGVATEEKSRYLISLKLSTWLTYVDVALDCLPQAVFARFLLCKVSLFSPLHSVVFEKKITVISSHLRREVLLHFTEEGYQLFGILLWRGFISYPPHMYWFDYLLYHYGLFIYLFYYLSEVIIQCYLILLFRIFQLWSLRVLLAISSAPLTILVLSYGFFFFFSWAFHTSYYCKLLQAHLKYLP